MVDTSIDLPCCQSAFLFGKYEGVVVCITLSLCSSGWQLVLLCQIVQRTNYQESFAYI